MENGHQGKWIVVICQIWATYKILSLGDLLLFIRELYMYFNMGIITASLLKEQTWLKGQTFSEGKKGNRI